MKRITVPLAISSLVLVVYGTIELFKPDLIGADVATYLLAALLVGWSVVLVRAIGYVLFDVIFERRNGRAAPQLLRVFLSVVLYLISFLLIYKFVVNRNGAGLGIIATSTIVSVVIGLALQDTLGNFFAGLSLHIEQPFHILDAIRIAGDLGRVEAVTWRTTTMRTNNNTTIVFPNSRVAREPMEVYRGGVLPPHPDPAGRRSLASRRPKEAHTPESYWTQQSEISLFPGIDWAKTRGPIPRR